METQLDEKINVNMNTCSDYLRFSTFKCLIPVALAAFIAGELVYVLFTKTLGTFQSEEGHTSEMDDTLCDLGIIVGVYFIAILLKRGLVVIILNDINNNIHNAMMK